MSDPTIPAAMPVDPAAAPPASLGAPGAPTPATVAAELQQAASDVAQFAAQPVVAIDPARPMLAELVALLNAKYQGLGSDLNTLLARAKAVLAA